MKGSIISKNKNVDLCRLHRGEPRCFVYRKVTPFVLTGLPKSVTRRSASPKLLFQINWILVGN